MHPLYIVTSPSIRLGEGFGYLEEVQLGDLLIHVGTIPLDRGFELADRYEVFILPDARIWKRLYNGRQFLGKRQILPFDRGIRHVLEQNQFHNSQLNFSR